MARSRRHAPLSTVVVGALLCATLLLSACDVRLPIGSATTAPHRGGSIVDAILGDPDALLPEQVSTQFDAEADQAIWAPLWYGDATGAFHPGLASAVPSPQNGGISPDLKTWTIHLKPNLKWSDGSPLTAADVAYSLNTFADPHFANTGGFPLHDPADPIDFMGASVLDPTTVRFTLAHPFVGMNAILADGSSAPIPQEVFGAMQPAEIAKSHQIFFPTVTSGPFKVSDHVQGDHLTVVRNPNYFQGPDKPYLDQITFKPFPTPEAVLGAAQAGRLDAAYGAVGNVAPRLLDSYRALPDYTTTLDRYPVGYEAIVFNLTNPILKDKAVRQALALSLDPRQVRALVQPGILLPTCDDHAGNFAHEPRLTCYPQDPIRAGQLLDDDGWLLGSDGVRHKDGKALELTYATGNLALNPWRSGTETLAQQSWARIGVKLDISNDDNFFDLLDHLAHGTFDIAEFYDSTGYEPDDHDFFMCGRTPDAGGSNYMRYCNPTVDQAEIAQQATADQAQRLAAFHTIDAAVLDDLPVMYLYSGVAIGINRSTLRNFMPFPYGYDLWNCWEWYLDQG